MPFGHRGTWGTGCTAKLTSGINAAVGRMCAKMLSVSNWEAFSGFSVFGIPAKTA